MFSESMPTGRALKIQLLLHSIKIRGFPVSLLLQFHESTIVITFFQVLSSTKNKKIKISEQTTKNPL